MALETTYMGNQIDPDMPLSKKYTLRDLCVTETGLPNWPEPESNELKNLRWLADTLERLEADIGPFDIASAYRSPGVNAAVGGSPKSFHCAGMAADLRPTQDSPDVFFGKILASDWLAKLGEIEYKPQLKNIHVSLPTDKTKSKVTVMDDAGKLIRQTTDQIAQWTAKVGEVIARYADIAAGEVADFFDDSEDDEYADTGEPIKAGIPVLPLTIGFLLLAGGTAIFLSKKNKR
jgi:uncharacterized protein YcbK (DUF882 family)